VVVCRLMFIWYQMVFDYIVKRISASLQPEGIDGSQLPCIGVLDIFGFECFAENGLEQLLINYANESLQLTFNRAVLQAEQQMYIEEGMQVALVEFVDNSSCVEMIARSKNSILATLDSVCKAPKPTEDKFNTHVHQVGR
jgi:myosin heavy subunit